MSAPSKFAEVVEPLLVKRGWSHGQLAKAMGASPAQVSRWFSGKREVTTRAVTSIARALGLAVDPLARALNVAGPVDPHSYAALELLRLQAEQRASLAEIALDHAQAERKQLEELVRTLHAQLASVAAERDILYAKLRATKAETRMIS